MLKQKSTNEQKISESKSQLEKLQTNTARFAALSAFLLAVLKLIIAMFTSSMALLASALDSIMDVTASTINYYSIRQALKPPDRQHPFGHGKLESLASLLQGQIMIASAIYVIYASFQKFKTGGEVNHLAVGIGVMIFSVVFSIVIYQRLKYVAKKTNSLALYADSLHYGSDALSNLGVMASLVIIHFTGWVYIDFIFSIFVSLYIIYAAGMLMKSAIDILMDRTLPDDKIDKIHNIILSFEQVESYHLLKTRRAGNRLFVEFHVVAPSLKTFVEAHALSRKIGDTVASFFNSDVEVNIHMDPADDEDQNIRKADGAKGISSVSWEERSDHSKLP